MLGGGNKKRALFLRLSYCIGFGSIVQCKTNKSGYGQIFVLTC